MVINTFTKTNELYARALKTVPLASQTFSKSAMNFVEGASPLFLERGEGSTVWDVDGNKYVDFMLGLLPIVLGYRDPDVDEAIRAQLDKGIIFSLACSLEAELAENLVRLIPCAEMVRYGKNGSDATSGAIRLARAFTKRDKIALCGYHGWHDWYIGTTARHLGVPDAVRSLSTPFPFNDADQLEDALKRSPKEFAAVILEPAGTIDPAPGFLERVREITESYGVLLIFDEIVTGFRAHMGGAQALYGVIPDISCFGKAMGNGMPISAVVGRRQFMQSMEDIFFSGTFGGEALSLAASIATIRKLEEIDGIGKIHAAGVHLTEGLDSAFQEFGLSDYFATKGPDWRPVVAVNEGDIPAPIAASLLRQELIAHGILVGGAFNICVAHDPHTVDTARSTIHNACESVALAFESGDATSMLRGKPIRPVFQVRKQ